jgi:hypothetical protein
VFVELPPSVAVELIELRTALRKQSREGGHEPGKYFVKSGAYDCQVKARRLGRPPARARSCSLSMSSISSRSSGSVAEPQDGRSRSRRTGAPRADRALLPWPARRSPLRPPMGMTIQFSVPNETTVNDPLLDTGRSGFRSVRRQDFRGAVGPDGARIPGMRSSSLT